MSLCIECRSPTPLSLGTAELCDGLTEEAVGLQETDPQEHRGGQVTLQPSVSHILWLVNKESVVGTVFLGH
jgi:hypothetical protein